MYKLARRFLYADLLVLLLGSVIAQILVPIYASQVGTRFPEVAYLVVPYSAAAILFIGCGQAVLLAAWRLLSLIGSGRIFTSRALPWVNVIVACAAAATLLSGGVWIHMLGVVPGGGGPMGLYMAAPLAGGLALVLLMVVIRGLLESVLADQAGSGGAI